MPNTADVVDVRPCDPNDSFVSNRGWLNVRERSEVVVFQSSSDTFDSGAHAIVPAYKAGTSPGLELRGSVRAVDGQQEHQHGLLPAGGGCPRA